MFPERWPTEAPWCETCIVYVREWPSLAVGVRRWLSMAVNDSLRLSAALLEQAVLDIVDQENGEVARINGYVRMMQAQEPHPDASTIQMIIRYVDDDPEKLATLSRFIAKVR